MPRGPWKNHTKTTLQVFGVGFYAEDLERLAQLQKARGNLSKSELLRALVREANAKVAVGATSL